LTPSPNFKARSSEHSQEAGLGEHAQRRKADPSGAEARRQQPFAPFADEDGDQESHGCEDAGAAESAYREVSALLDRMASRRIIHPNKAARKKSQLARHVATLGS
jgi:hypothetical protein